MMYSALLKILVVAKLALMMTACGEAQQVSRDVASFCMTDEGPAYWTGRCEGGRAQGQGTATYSDYVISTIDGLFIDGNPVGMVKIEYRNGGYYHGEVLDGEPNGFGLNMEAWGEGYEGAWEEGYEHGQGTYISSDGTRMAGVWRKGRGLVASWYRDKATGCEVSWAADSNPIGQLSWSGECVNGRAHGQGTVLWSDFEYAPMRSHVRFDGEFKDGVMQGRGIWKSESVSTNLMQTTEFAGGWVDGERQGHGREVRIARLPNRGEIKSIDTREGEWQAGEFTGQGRREMILSNDDGSTRTTVTEIMADDGVFTDENLYPDGRRTLEKKEGKFYEGEFSGHGVWNVEINRPELKLTKHIAFEGRLEKGGQGFVLYDQKSRFDGHFDSSGSPVLGTCDFPSENYSGKCKSKARSVSRYAGEVCLVPVNDVNRCLKRIEQWIF